MHCIYVHVALCMVKGEQNYLLAMYCLFFLPEAVIVEGRSPPYPLHNNVTLNCTTSLQGNIIWSVNEYQLNNERRLVIWQAQGVIVQPIRPTLSIVTITSQTRFNNTRFRCEVEGPGALDGIIGMSEFINFIIYGELSLCGLYVFTCLTYLNFNCCSKHLLKL